MTEDLIERMAERRMDALDRLFIGGALTQKQYDEAIEGLNYWVDVEYNKIVKAKAQPLNEDEGDEYATQFAREMLLRFDLGASCPNPKRQASNKGE